MIPKRDKTNTVYMFIDLKKERKKRVNKRIHTPHKMYSQTKRQQQIAPFLVNPQQNILEKSHTTHSNCKNLIVFFFKYQTTLLYQ